MVEFRVPHRVAVTKFVVAAGVAALSLLANGPAQVVVALVAAAGIAAYGVRDLVAPLRLRLDETGIVAGRRAFPWAAIEAVRIDSRLRLGLRAEAVEIDAGDDILLFAASDLGVPVTEAAATVERFRERAGSR